MLTFFMFLLVVSRLYDPLQGAYRIWPAVYRRTAKKPIDEKKVLLASNSKTLPDNLSCMKRELEARGMHCTEMLIPAGAGSISARAAEFRQNIRFQREYATSKLVFVEDAFFPLFANHPRKGTEVIQLWHACGAFKKWEGLGLEEESTIPLLEPVLSYKIELPSVTGALSSVCDPSIRWKKSIRIVMK